MSQGTTALIPSWAAILDEFADYAPGACPYGKGKSGASSARESSWEHRYTVWTDLLLARADSPDTPHDSIVQIKGRSLKKASYGKSCDPTKAREAKSLSSRFRFLLAQRPDLSAQLRTEIQEHLDAEPTERNHSKATARWQSRSRSLLRKCDVGALLKSLAKTPRPNPDIDSRIRTLMLCAEWIPPTPASPTTDTRGVWIQ